MSSKAKQKPKIASAPQKDQTTLVEPSFWEKNATRLYLFLAFFIPFSLMFLAFAVAGVAPFGTNQIHVTDLWHQYYPFMADFQDKLQSGGSLLWTWRSGGGTNYIALMSYYLASPLNFLSVLIPASGLRIFLYIATCAKIGFAGLFYALFLKLTFKRRDVSITAFGVLYALCAFIVGYYWNVIWLDTIALLPLVIAGTFALLRYGKFKLYIISLALSILANYYIGLFTCAFVLLVSIGYVIVEYKGWKDLIRQFFKMLGCSILSVMMSAILTLPTFFALKYTHSSDNTFPQGFSINIGSTADFGGVLEGIGKTIANSVAFVQPTTKEGLPNVYSGIIVIFLAILFFFCKKIKVRERLVCGGMLLFFMLSFVIRQLDYIWHGFHFPNMLPYRFSFLYTFVIIYMAFRVFMYIDEIKPISVIAALCAFAVYLGIAASYYDGTTVKLSPILSGSPNADPVLLSGLLALILAAWVLLYSLRDMIPRPAMLIGAGVIGLGAMIFVIANAKILNAAVSKNGSQPSSALTICVSILIFLLTVAALLLMSSKEMNGSHQMTKVVLSVLLLILAVVEGLFSSAAGVKLNGVTDATTYPLGGDDTLACVAKINDLEKDTIDLPHAEVNKYHSLNDNALIGINGISMFNSVVNKDVTAYMEKFGLCGWVASNRYTYQESSPFTNLMLNMKYIISPYGVTLDATHNELVFQSSNVTLQRNKYYLPQGFVVNKELMDFDVDSAPLHPMANQNRMFTLATGIAGDLYEFMPVTSATASEGASLSSISDGNFSYSSTDTNGSLDITYTAPRDGVVSAYFSTGGSDNTSIRVNGNEVISYYTKRPFIMMAGNVKQGDQVTLHAQMSNSSNASVTAYCAMFNDDLFTQAYNKLSASTLKATKVTDTEISGDVTAAQDGLFYTSISYSPGWTATVDGVKTEITPVGKALVAFPISAGAHHVELHYTPEGFVPGALCTVLAILIFIGMIFLIPRREKLLAKFKKEKASAPDAPEE